MFKPYSFIAAILHLLIAIALAIAVWQAVDIRIAGQSLPYWAPVAALAATLLAGAGAFIESLRGEPEPESEEGPVSREMVTRSKRFTVHAGKSYKARISLNFFEQMASNDMIAQKFEEAGFSDVRVSGSGGDREAIGRWTKADATAEMPSQVVTAVEMA